MQYSGTIQVIGGQLFARYEQNAHSLLRRFMTDGKPLGEIEMPTLGTICAIWRRIRQQQRVLPVLVVHDADTIYRFDIGANKSTVWDSIQTGLDTSQYETKQVWYASKDGTRVPMFLVMRKKGCEPNGHNPALLTGYGGFNISLTPDVQQDDFSWLERGGVFAVANLRGGAEFGEDWHRAGMLDKKQNVFDDFIAAAEYLITKEGTPTRNTSRFGAAATAAC